MIKFFVEGHPESDHRPRVTGYGAYMREEYLTWREVIGYTALQHVDEPLTGWLVVSLHFVTKSWERQDLDNLAKGVLEGLEGTLYDDDRQVTSLHLFKSQPENVEGVLVLVWPVLEFATEWERSMVDLFSLVREQEEEV